MLITVIHSIVSFECSEIRRRLTSVRLRNDRTGFQWATNGSHYPTAGVSQVCNAYYQHMVLKPLVSASHILARQAKPTDQSLVNNTWFHFTNLPRTNQL